MRRLEDDGLLGGQFSKAFVHQVDHSHLVQQMAAISRLPGYAGGQSRLPLRETRLGFERTSFSKHILIALCLFWLGLCFANLDFLRHP